MKTTYRDYPHPVLSFFNDDYKDKDFTSSITPINNNNTIDLIIDFNLNCNTLQTLLDNNQAEYLIHIECRRTRFRNAYNTTDSNYKISIEESLINGQLEIVTSIISKNNIDDFTSIEFHDDFKDNSFKIETGDVLAIAMDQVINIKKQDNELKKSSSLFNITLSDSDDPLTWFIDNDSILVKLPKNSFDRYRNLISSTQSQNILTSIIVAPVLTEILTLLKNDADCFDSVEFIDILNITLKNIGIQISDLKNIDPICNITYKIIDNLLPNALYDLENLIMNGGD